MTRVVVMVALLASGCDALFQLDHIKRIDAGDEPGVDGNKRSDAAEEPDALVKCAVDTFDENQLNTTLWKLVPDPVTGNNVNVVDANQLLEIDLAASQASMQFNGITSKSSYDMGSVDIQVELVEAPTQTSGTQVEFTVSDGATSFKFAVISSMLDFIVSTSSVGQLAGFTDYSSGVLYLRFHVNNTQMEFQTSLDGMTWTTQQMSSVPANTAAMFITLRAGTYQAVSSPGRALFNDMIVAGRGCTQ